MKKTAILFLMAFTFAMTMLSSCSKSPSGDKPAVLAADSVKTWEDMNHDQRKLFMKATILPAMRKEFHDFDSTKFGSINCKTCHGESAVADDSFTMPNPDLPVLPSTPAGFEKLMNGKKAAIFSFMSHNVKPKMAKLLSMPEFDPKTGAKGFGCGNCHTMEEKK